MKEQTDRKIQWIRDAAGARLDDIEIQMRFFVCEVTDDRMGMADALAPAFGVEPEDALEAGAALVGSENEIIEQLQRRREEWGLSLRRRRRRERRRVRPRRRQARRYLTENPRYAEARRGSTPRAARAAPPRPA